MCESRIFRDYFMSLCGELVFLTGCHRQVRLAWFLGCLDRVRAGSVTDADIMVINATSAGVSDEIWNTRTQLRALNRQVDAYNDKKMQDLGGAETMYKSYDEMRSSIRHPGRRAYTASRLVHLAPPSVTLKPWAVVLTTRPVHRIPTATQGIVLHCRNTFVVCQLGGKEVYVQFASFDLIDNRYERLASRCAIPLALAWAMTIHPAQGATLDTLAVGFNDLYWRQEGLVYHALSRCRSLEGHLVRGLRRDLIVISPECQRFHGL